MGNSIKQKIHILSRNPNDRKSLNDLIGMSLNIAVTYLKIKFFSDINPKLKWQDNIEEIAMDAIVPLFVSNRDGKLGIIKALENWKSEITSDSDSYFFLNRVIWKRVEQTVIIKIKQRDPIFARIHKNLSTCIATHNFKKLSYLGTVYIVHKNTDEINGKLIPDDEFENLPGYLFEKKQFKLCNGILDYLVTETEYFPAIPMNRLVVKIKQQYFRNSESNSLSAVTKTNEYIDDIFTLSLQKINDKIYNSYYSKGKLTKDESDAIYKSFEIMAKEISNGGLNSSLYDYLQINMKDLTKEKFYTDYHGIMNYLLIGFKKNISKLFEI